jgi:hypothetical protein
MPDKFLSDSAELTSSCLCGQAVINIHGRPRSTHYCHCEICQNIHAAPFGLIAVYRKDQVTLPAKPEEVFDTYEAKENLIVYRCKKCGVPMFSWTGNYNVWGIYVGANIRNEGGELIKPMNVEEFRGGMHMFYSFRQQDMMFYSMEVQTDV